MKKILSFFLFLFMATFAMAQQYIENVYLKNGSIIKGVVIEQVPNQSVKIQTSGGNIFVYEMSDVEKITKEAVVASQPIKGTVPLEVSKKSILYLGDKMLSDEEALQLLGEDYYDTFKSASKQIRKGRTFLTIGLSSLAATAVMTTLAIVELNYYYYDSYYYGNYDLYYASAIAFGAIADVFIPLGCVFKGVGKGRRSWVVESYNENYVVSAPNGSLNISPAIIRTSNLLSQHNGYAVGATINVTF